MCHLTVKDVTSTKYNYPSDSKATQDILNIGKSDAYSISQKATPKIAWTYNYKAWLNTMWHIQWDVIQP